MDGPHLTRILAIIDNLEIEYRIGGSEDRDGTLQPGRPDFEEARAEIRKTFEIPSVDSPMATYFRRRRDR